MKANDLLANVRIASPCHARWGHMVGDERARFCGECSKHVYNLSALTAEEAAALIREKEGQLCARFYQRPDGTVLTADCPVGAARGWGRLKSLFTAGATATIMAFAGLFRADAAPGGVPVDKKNPVQPAIGPTQPVLMGDICIKPPVTNAPVRHALTNVLVRPELTNVPVRPEIMGRIIAPPVKTNAPLVK